MFVCLIEERELGGLFDVQGARQEGDAQQVVDFRQVDELGKVESHVAGYLCGAAPRASIDFVPRAFPLAAISSQVIPSVNAGTVLWDIHNASRLRVE